MSEFSDKNMARRVRKGAAGSRERHMWLSARARRRALPHGAFGLLKRHNDTKELHRELSYGTRGEV